mmetsp:Transcript_27772/g.23784  ORF Transcript_27772/g.23784 Transcript_27772/m.23784 type:complete len:110 (+) Transcript_27772:170-499(+)
MCIWWLSGHCSHGSKCRFAHGEAELRSATKSDSTMSSVDGSSPRSERTPRGDMTKSSCSSSLAPSYGFEHAATFDCGRLTDPVYKACIDWFSSNSAAAGAPRLSEQRNT